MRLCWCSDCKRSILLVLEWQSCALVADCLRHQLPILFFKCVLIELILLACHADFRQFLNFIFLIDVDEDWLNLLLCLRVNSFHDVWATFAVYWIGEDKLLCLQDQQVANERNLGRAIVLLIWKLGVDAFDTSWVLLSVNDEHFFDRLENLCTGEEDAIESWRFKGFFDNVLDPIWSSCIALFLELIYRLNLYTFPSVHHLT